MEVEPYLVSFGTDDSSSKVLLEDGLGEGTGEGDSEDLTRGSEEVGDWREEREESQRRVRRERVREESANLQWRQRCVLDRRLR